MKITSGVFAVLLLVAAVAVGQQHASYAEPFPQSANPALANGPRRGVVTCSKCRRAVIHGDQPERHVRGAQ